MNNWITGHVEKYLNRRRSDQKPFFLSVGFFDPHHPFDPCEPYASMYAKEDMPMPRFSEAEEDGMPPHTREKRHNEKDFCTDPDKIRQTIAAYYATISHVDDCVGRVLQALRACGLEDNTVIIFTSDHGELLGDHGMIHKGAFFYENSVKVPLIWRFPQNHNGDIGRQIDDFVSHIDFAPTVCKLAGIKCPDNCQGRALFGEDRRYQTDNCRDYALVEWRNRHWEKTDEEFFTAKCLVTDSWKLVCYPGREFGELYDLENDPDEFVNLWQSPEHLERKMALLEKLVAVMSDIEICPKRVDCF